MKAEFITLDYLDILISTLLVLVAAGVSVIDIGIVPTPVAAWAQRHLGTQGAVIVTASHNPAQYNGIKFALGDRPAGPADLERVRGRLAQGRFRSAGGSSVRREVRDDYLAWLQESCAGSAAGLSVLVDAGNGCAAGWAPAALRQAGARVEELFCEPDGTFPNRSPNPARPEAVELTGAAVRRRRVDFAVAFDGEVYAPVSYTHLTLPTN